MSFQPEAILKNIFEGNISVNKSSLLNFCFQGSTKQQIDKSESINEYYVLIENDPIGCEVGQKVKFNLIHTYYSIPQTLNLLKLRVEAGCLSKNLLKTTSVGQSIQVLDSFITENIAAFYLVPDTKHSLFKNENLEIVFLYSDTEENQATMIVTYFDKVNGIDITVAHCYSDKENGSYVSNRIATR